VILSFNDQKEQDVELKEIIVVHTNTCPICKNQLDFQKEKSSIYVCKACKQPIHKICYKSSLLYQTTCPLCRGEDKDALELMNDSSIDISSFPAAVKKEEEIRINKLIDKSRMTIVILFLILYLLMLSPWNRILLANLWGIPALFFVLNKHEFCLAQNQFVRPLNGLGQNLKWIVYSEQIRKMYTCVRDGSEERNKIHFWWDVRKNDPVNTKYNHMIQQW
jgi:uncharacterized protein YbaR (Trm112 family)